MRGPWPDFTAMGDALNVTGGLSLDDLETRELELKGRKKATQVRVGARLNRWRRARSRWPPAWA
jgi:hypothetical protein